MKGVVFMKGIKCELCGSNSFTKVDGMFRCDYCGTKYTLEEAKTMVSGSVFIRKDVKVQQSEFKIKNGVLEVYKGLATKVKIPNIVTSIGNCAFGYHANLESVIIIK